MTVGVRESLLEDEVRRMLRFSRCQRAITGSCCAVGTQVAGKIVGYARKSKYYSGGNVRIGSAD